MIVRFFDLETTDFINGNKYPQIIQYAFVTWNDGLLVDVRQRYVMPTEPVTESAAKANGFDFNLWSSHSATPLNEADIRCFHELMGGQFVGGQNILGFDLPIIKAECNRLGFAAPVHDYHVVDTMPMSVVLQVLGLVPSASLKTISEYLKIQDKFPAFSYATGGKPHDAVYDAVASALVFNEYLVTCADAFAAKGQVK
jgi:DNA polymerase III epsilon subunit-like protein